MVKEELLSEAIPIPAHNSIEIKTKRDLEEQETLEQERHELFDIKTIYRIVTRRKKNRGGTVCIDIREYCRRTGKIFKAKDYQRFFHHWEKERVK